MKEYKFDTFKHYSSLYDTFVNSYLNKIGSLGWELISISVVEMDAFDYDYHYKSGKDFKICFAWCGEDTKEFVRFKKYIEEQKHAPIKTEQK